MPDRLLVPRQDPDASMDRSGLLNQQQGPQCGPDHQVDQRKPNQVYTHSRHGLLDSNPWPELDSEKAASSPLKSGCDHQE